MLQEGCRRAAGGLQEGCRRAAGGLQEDCRGTAGGLQGGKGPISSAAPTFPRMSKKNAAGELPHAAGEPPYIYIERASLIYSAPRLTSPTSPESASPEATAVDLTADDESVASSPCSPGEISGDQPGDTPDADFAPLARGDIEEMWEAEEVADLLREGDCFDFEPEHVEATHSLAAEMSQLRADVDAELARWPVSPQGSDTHAIYIVSLFLHMGIPWDARSDMLCARLLALLQGGDMRAHEEAVYQYSHGHLETLSEIPAHKVKAMEEALSRAPAFFYDLMIKNAPRDMDSVGAMLKDCLPATDSVVQKSQFDMHMRSSAKGRGKGAGIDHQGAAPHLSLDARWWGEAGLELYPLRLKFTRKLDTTFMLEVYHAWFRTDRPADQGVVDFKDISVKVSIQDGRLSLSQVAKSRSNDCYIHIPVSIGYRPADADIQRLRRVICTGYAGQDYERKAIWAMESLALAGRGMPQICIVLRGRGRNTKSSMSKIRASVLGSGHKFVPSSVLHVPEEMRKQLLHFSQARCITIKECKGRVRLEEDVTKNLFGRDELDARLLFGRETKMFALEHCAMFWEMNMVPPRISGDPTDVAGLESWWRRCLICDMNSSFTSNMANVAPEDRVFATDPTLPRFLKSGTAALVYLRYFLLPFMKRHSEDDCLHIIEDPPESVLQKSKDFVVDMASDVLPDNGHQGSTEGGEPTDAFAPQPKSEAQLLVERIHEHHKPEQFIKMSEVERNRMLPGAARSSKCGKITRVQHVRTAVQEFPYLLHEQTCRPVGFHRLQINLELFNTVMAKYGEQKFGTFESWGSVFEKSRRTHSTALPSW